MSEVPSLDWTEIAKDEFRSSRPVVSRSLVVELWRHWQAHSPDGSLFGDPIQDVALLLHARAYGEPVPMPGDRSALGRLLRDHEHLFEPLCKPALTWGPRANLSGAGWPAAESPIMDAWIYRDGTLPSGVLIVGEGLPEIRELLLPTAFMLSVVIGTLDSDMVNNTVIRADLPLAGRPPLKIPVNLLGSHPGYLPEDVPNDARDAMHRFLHTLRELSDATGLIRLHEADVEIPYRLQHAVRSRAERQSANALLWAPGLGDSDLADAAALLPFSEIPSGAALQLPVSGDLLQTSAYKALDRIYRRSTVERIKADVELRRDTNRREAERMDLEHQSYKDTPKEHRAAIWGDKVILSIRYDHLLDRTVHIDPHHDDAETYYLHRLPVLAQRHRDNADLMEHILQSIISADNRPDSPIKRLIAGRLIDAAVRADKLTDSPAMSEAFAKWSEQVQPMLWLEWRSHLEASGIRLGDVFSRNTVLHTAQAEGTNGRELLMVPQAILHQQRTSVLVDRRRRTTVYHDAARYARATSLVADQRIAEVDWERIEETARLGNAAETEVDDMVRTVLMSDPAQGTIRILSVLTDTPSELAKKVVSPETLDSMESALDNAVKATTRLRAFRRAAVALYRGAPQTARSYLAMVGGDNRTLALKAALLEAVLEFLEAGGDPKRVFELAAGVGPGGVQRVASAIIRARELDAEYTGHWLESLHSVKLSPAVARLQHDLPSLVDLLPNNTEFAAWTSRVAVETARLARNLEAASASLDEDGEPVAVALAKLGQSLEESFLDEFAGASRDAASELMAVLTGSDRSFGRRPDDDNERE